MAAPVSLNVRFRGAFMRIKESIIRSGYFWAPEAPDNKLPGTLTISDGGEIELEVIGNFDLGPSLPSPSDELDVKKIFGQIEKAGCVTIDDCIYRHKNFSFGGIAKSTLHGHRALFGVHLSDEEPQIDTYRCSLEGLDEWIVISGIEVKTDFEKKTAQITFKPPPRFSYDLGDGFTIAIIFGWSAPFSGGSTEAKITQQAYLEIRSKKLKPLGEFIYIAYRFANFLALALDESTSFKDVTISSERIVRNWGTEEEENTRPIQIETYYQSLPFSDSAPKLRKNDILFTFPQVKDKLGTMLSSWLIMYEAIGPALSLYFASKAGEHKYLDGKFLALAQALETYHRRTSKEVLMDEKKFKRLVDNLIAGCLKEQQGWLKGRLSFGNELSLAKRLKKVFDPYKEQLGNSSKRSKLIRQIVDTRNYLTHYSERLESTAARGRQMWEICMKMEVIFQLCLLRDVGLTSAEVSNVANNSYSIKQKLNEI